MNPCLSEVKVDSRMVRVYGEDTKRGNGCLFIIVLIVGFGETKGKIAFFKLITI